eukprot:m.62462 g.62462  ORF g.62462 m.62462 type:complete len:445 (-) comp23159_c0_seq1:99-1433(-)
MILRRVSLCTLWVVLHLSMYTGLRYALRNVPFSAFWDPDMQHIYAIQEARQRWSYSYLNHLRLQSNQSVDSRSNIKNTYHNGRGDEHHGHHDHDDNGSICIGWTALNNRAGHVLVASVASVLYGGAIANGTFPSHTSKIANGITPVVYVTQEGNTTMMADDVLRLKQSGIPIVFERIPHERCAGCDWHVNENKHYLRVLELCLERSTAAHIVVLEEDSWGTKNFLPKLRDTIRRVKRKVQHDPSLRPYFSVKLFVTAYWDGWGQETVLELVGLGFVAAGAVVAAVRVWMNRLPQPKFLLVLFAWCWGVACFVLFACGRQGLGLGISRKGIHAHDIGASTVGVVYPRESVEQILKLLPHPPYNALPVDVAISRVQHDVDKDQYVVVPCLVEHTGMNSSSAIKRAARFSMTPQNMWKLTKHASRFDGDLSLDELVHPSWLHHPLSP